MHADQKTVRPGQVVQLAVNGPAGSRFIGFESWGTFGKADDGRFIALFNISAVIPRAGIASHPDDLRVTGQPQPLGGVGLPNRPFLIRIPHVPDGSYLVRFEYTVSRLTRTGLSKLGLRKNSSYLLCSPVSVRA